LNGIVVPSCELYSFSEIELPESSDSEEEEEEEEIDEAEATEREAMKA